MNIAHYATGLQHIGFPTKDFDGSVEFYTGLGFSAIARYVLDGNCRVVFLKLHDLVVEIWEGEPTGKSGSIDHMAIDVTDIDAVYTIATGAGLSAIEGKVCELPFWDRGVRYFTVNGPNAEKIEFIQKL